MFIKFKCLDNTEVVRKTDIKSFVLKEGKMSTMHTYHNDVYTLKTEVINTIIEELEKKEDNEDSKS